MTLEKTADEVASAAASRVRPHVLNTYKEQLKHWVSKEANRPPKIFERVVDSVAFRGLLNDYSVMCQGYQGGLMIVYDRSGSGKSFALQAVARTKSTRQADRFLVINIQGSRSCQDLYDFIKAQVLGKVEDITFSAVDVADVIHYGLCGSSAVQQEGEKLPKTSNNCRIQVEATTKAISKQNNWPILVIDEFNPTDFTEEDWPAGKDFSMRQLEEKLGDAFSFFNYLAGLAYSGNGFCVLVGTNNEAFARALHKINGGTKAALANCTVPRRTPGTGAAHGTYPFEDWKGFQWSSAEKGRVVQALHGDAYKNALLSQGKTDDNAATATIDFVNRLCSDDHKTVWMCCNDMELAINGEKEDATALLACRTQTPTSDGCFAGFQEQVENAGCVII
jgi:hypothetical protein